MTPSEPTFVFLPGLGEDHRSFKHQTAAFPNSYAVDWIDPLFGESLEQYAVRLAEVIRRELNRRSVSSVIVCGHSLGGMVAPYVARELDAAGYVLLASIRKPDQFPKRYYCYWLLLRLCPPLQPILLFFARLFARFFLCFPRVMQCFISPEVVQASVEMPLFRMSGLLRMMFNWAYRHRLPEENKSVFDNSILHVHGTNDWALPIRLTNPDIRLEGVGHFPTLSHPERINEILGRFADEF